MLSWNENRAGPACPRRVAARDDVALESHTAGETIGRAGANRAVRSLRVSFAVPRLIASRRQLERVLGMYVDHYNGHRPHRGLGLVAPQPRPGLRLVAPPHPPRVRRRDRLGGLIHEYRAAA